MKENLQKNIYKTKYNNKIIAKKRKPKINYDGNVKLYYNVTSKRYVIDDLTEWITENCFDNAYAVTLTLKQSAYFVAKDNINWGYQEVDTINASRNLRYFLNKLNLRLFGKSATNKNPLKKKRLKCIPFFEGNPYSKTHLHYHIILEKHSSQTECEFRNYIKDNWVRTEFGQSEIDIKPIEGFNGWLGYCTKEKSQEHFGNNIDVMNLYLGNQN